VYFVAETWNHNRCLLSCYTKDKNALKAEYLTVDAGLSVVTMSYKGLLLRENDDLILFL